jgi:hypothetical protein
MVEAGRTATRRHRWAAFALVTTVAVGSASVITLAARHEGNPTAPQTQTRVAAPDHRVASVKSAGATARTPPTVSAAALTPPVVPTPPAAVTPPSIASLVAAVEASGVEPGSNWTWSMGDPSTHCGAISGAGTGCTYGEAGREYTIFAGTPTVALVAHELGNAETQNDAVPNLLDEVAAAAAGTSWSPTDAVASCLVVHFMGFQDDAAGSWQCPVALASVVADHIHDTY